jgi:phage gp36-like protein
MPDYCTLEEVVDVLTRNVAEVEGNAASVDREAVLKAIVDAQAEIDSRLATKYTVPFNPVPALVASLAQDIAAYLADLVFRENRDYGSELSPIYLRYQRAQAQLGRLATGEAVIPPTGNNPENPPETGSGLRVAAAYSRPGLIDGCEFDIRIGCASQPAPYWSAEGWAIHP